MAVWTPEAGALDGCFFYNYIFFKKREQSHGLKHCEDKAKLHTFLRIN